jgi:hypothetical protein
MKLFYMRVDNSSLGHLKVRKAVAARGIEEFRQAQASTYPWKIVKGHSL